MTHHMAADESVLTEYREAEHEYESVVREFEHLKNDPNVPDSLKQEQQARISAVRLRFEDASHKLTGVVGPHSEGPQAEEVPSA